jgi:cell division protein FtsQ
MTNAEIINRNSFLRLKTKNIRRAVIRRIFYILITAVLCLLFLIICAALFFKIQTIEVRGNVTCSADELVAISGVQLGQNLYSVSGSTVSARIRRACTYVNSVKIYRRLPSTLVIEVKEDTAEYYIELAGEYFSMSSDFRVLDRVDSKDELTQASPGIKFIAVPEVRYCVVGSEIAFRRAVNLKFVDNLMTEIRLWKLYDTIDYIDMSDKFNIKLICGGGKYRILLGGRDEMKMKLDFARAIIETSLQNDEIAQINVEYTDSAVVTLEDELFKIP